MVNGEHHWTGSRRPASLIPVWPAIIEAASALSDHLRVTSWNAVCGLLGPSSAAELQRLTARAESVEEPAG